jgi:putative DNA primase/helicase
VIHKWEPVIGDRLMTTLEVIEIATKQTAPSGLDGKRFVHDAFREALLAVAGNGGVIDSRRLGTWLGGVKDRIVNGKKIVLGKMSSGSNQWQLIHLAASRSGPDDETSSNLPSPLADAA